MYTLQHKVVTYPTVALRQRRLAASNNNGDPSGVASGNSGVLLQSSSTNNTNNKDTNNHLLANVNKINPTQNATRSRSLSAGRPRQQGASDLIQSVYDKLGVSRPEIGNGDDSASIGSPIKRNDRISPATEKVTNRYQPNASTTTTVVTPTTPTRGRSRQSISTTGVSTLGAASDVPDGHRRSRSLSQGPANPRWPPIQFPSSTTITTTSGVVAPSPRATYRTAASAAINNNNTSPGPAVKNFPLTTEFKEEKKSDEDVVEITSLECEDEVLRVTSPSVKDRLRIYGGSVADQANNNDSSNKNTPKNFAVDPKYAAQYAASKSHPPKINIFDNTNHGPYGTPQKSNDVSTSSNSKDDNTNDQGSITHTEASRPTPTKVTDRYVPTIKNSSNNSVADCAASTSGASTRNNNIANAFLVAITPKAQPKKPSHFTPVLEIQTSGDDTETHADTLSISMSSVSGDEFARQPTTDTNDNGHGSSAKRIPSVSSGDAKKSNSWHHERNRLSAYNNSSSLGRNNNSHTYSKLGEHTANNGIQSNHNSQHHQDGMAARMMEVMIEEQVNARMSEYEARMEKMILKFMQTVDEKMSAQMQNVESKINAVNTVLQRLQDTPKSSNGTNGSAFQRRNVQESYWNQQQSNQHPGTEI